MRVEQGLILKANKSCPGDNRGLRIPLTSGRIHKRRRQHQAVPIALQHGILGIGSDCQCGVSWQRPWRCRPGQEEHRLAGRVGRLTEGVKLRSLLERGWVQSELDVDRGILGVLVALSNLVRTERGATPGAMRSYPVALIYQSLVP